MSYIEILEQIERFQTVLVGAVGFVGVIWTMRANARNAIEEHQRQHDTRRASLRRILAAEFRNYSHALKSNLKMTPPEFELFSIGKVRHFLSESLASDLGLLEPGEIDAAVNAIISLDGMNHFLENIAQEQSNTRFLIPKSAWEDFRTAMTTTAHALDLAVQVLEGTGS